MSAHHTLLKGRLFCVFVVFYVIINITGCFFSESLPNSSGRGIRTTAYQCTPVEVRRRDNGNLSVTFGIRERISTKPNIDIYDTNSIHSTKVKKATVLIDGNSKGTVSKDYFVFHSQLPEMSKFGTELSQEPKLIIRDRGDLPVYYLGAFPRHPKYVHPIPDTECLIVGEEEIVWYRPGTPDSSVVQVFQETSRREDSVNLSVLLPATIAMDIAAFPVLLGGFIVYNETYKHQGTSPHPMGWSNRQANQICYE